MNNKSEITAVSEKAQVLDSEIASLGSTVAELKEPTDDLSPELLAEVLAKLDMANAQSIIQFGSQAQAELQAISQSMLGGVRNKDVGVAGDSLRQMVTSLRGFSAEELDPGRALSWWEKLLGKAKPIAEFTARYEQVRDQIDRISNDLLRHETQLLKDIKSLDKLYEKTLDFYRELAVYIKAGEHKLKSLDSETIPQLEQSIESQPDTLLAAQQLRDLRSARDDLERRVHDLKLTRQVTMQSLPSIRLVQENDKTLVTRISSALVNTVPLWETQLAQAVTIQHSREAAGSVRAVNDLTNELLNKNAENLRQANREVREQNERGVFDLEAVKSANANLIATIEESLLLADEGKQKRAQAELELVEMEQQLKTSLAAARAPKNADKG